MIKQVKMYECVCDRCGHRQSADDGLLYHDRESAEQIALESEWRTLGGKHYCPNCLEFDDDLDEWRPKPK